MTIEVGPVFTDALVTDGANRLWDFGFPFQSKDHVRLFVYNDDDEETEIDGADFDVTDPAVTGGSVTYPRSPTLALASGQHVRIERTLPYDQPNPIGNQGAFLARTHEDTFDYLSMQIQQIGARLDGVFYMPAWPDSGITDFRLPLPAAGYPLVWGAGGLVNGSVSLSDLGTALTSAEAAAEVALAYAAVSVNAYSLISDIAALAASGGIVDAAFLITYAGDWASTNVQDALDEAKAAVDDTAADITTLQAAVSALTAALALVASPRVVGEIVDYVGSAAPTGWAFCYGQTIGNGSSGAVLAGAGFEALFNAIGAMLPNTGAEVFATGGTRVLPDLRGRVVAGKDNMGGASAGRITNSGVGNPGLNGNSRGAAGGLDRRTLAASELPAHGHQYRVRTTGLSTPDGGGGLVTDAAETVNKAAFSGTPSLSPGEAIGGQGGTFGQAHPQVQPTLILPKIIYHGVA